MNRTVLSVTIAAAMLSAGCAARGTAAPAASLAPAGTGAPSAVRPAAAAIPDGYGASRNAAADITAALAAAARDHREVLIDFGANWCPDCRALAGMFRSPQVEPLLRKDYHVVAVDVGQFDRNLGVAARYLQLQTSGIPALVVLAPGGAVRTTTDDGSFANARTMDPGQVRAFLLRWAPAATG